MFLGWRIGSALRMLSLFIRESQSIRYDYDDGTFAFTQLIFSLLQIKVAVLMLERRPEGFPRDLEMIFSQLHDDKVRPMEVSFKERTDKPTYSTAIRPCQTEAGVILLTNVRKFSSSLNIIIVPDGDYEQHIADFILSLNLKRLGCGGRSTVTFTCPAYVCCLFAGCSMWLMLR